MGAFLLYKPPAIPRVFQPEHLPLGSSRNSTFSLRDSWAQETSCRKPNTLSPHGTCSFLHGIPCYKRTPPSNSYRHTTFAWLLAYHTRHSAYPHSYRHGHRGRNKTLFPPTVPVIAWGYELPHYHSYDKKCECLVLPQAEFGVVLLLPSSNTFPPIG